MHTGNILLCDIVSCCHSEMLLQMRNKPRCDVSITVTEYILTQISAELVHSDVFCAVNAVVSLCTRARHYTAKEVGTLSPRASRRRQIKLQCELYLLYLVITKQVVGMGVSGIRLTRRTDGGDCYSPATNSLHPLLPGA